MDRLAGKHNHDRQVVLGTARSRYYFRVRAVDQVGNWETGQQAMATPLPWSIPLRSPPWWNTGYANKRNLIILNNDGDTMPTGYPVRLRFNTTTTPTAAELYNASLNVN